MRIWSLACLTALCACTFDPSGIALYDADAPDIDAAPVLDDGGNAIDASPLPDAPDGCTDPVVCQGWWDVAYLFRRPLTVAVGALPPMNRYADYTVRLTDLDTATLIAMGEMRSDCNDLRIVRQTALNDPGIELPRHVLGCDSATTEVRFSLSADIADSGADDFYYLYYSDRNAAAPPALGTTDVYLWYDDASVDRKNEYDRGRFNDWGSNVTGWSDSATHDPAGYYGYDTGDNNVSSYRRPVSERDVYVEAEFMHEGCYAANMHAGVVARGVIASGTGASETSSHFYTSLRAHNSNCGDDYPRDGDIYDQYITSANGPAVDGVNPPSVIENQWRKQALAVWGVSPSNLTFWDADNPWPSLGWPRAGDVNASGMDANDHQMPGFAGLWVSQDVGRFRNVIIRRYTEPEPTVTQGATEPRL